MTIKHLSIYLPFILLILLPLITFVQTVNHEFVWDDDVHILYNQYDTQEKTDSILKYWSPKPKLIYAPVTYTIWGMLKSGKVSAVPFHMTNLIVHIVTVLVIFLIIKMVITNHWAALAGALLFAIHPIQVEAVAWATGLRTLLCGLFGFLMLWFYLLHRKYNKGRSWYITSLCMFILALASKPSAIIFPVFLLLFDYFYYKNPIKKSLIRLIPYLLLTIPFLWILMQTNTLPEYVAPLWTRPLIMTDTIDFYLYKLLLPFKLCSFYGRTPAYVMQTQGFYLSWIIPALLIWLLIKSHKKHPLLILSALLFFTGFLPVSGILAFEGQNWNTVADRYLYFSMLGSALFFACFIDKWRHKKIAWFIAAGMLLFWCLRSVLIQTPQWKNDWNIWNSAIIYFPDQSVPYSKRGEIYLENGDLQSALYDFQRAVQRNPNFAKAYNNIGLIYSNQEQWDPALEAYSMAIRINPRLTKTYKNIGLIFLIKNDYDKAEQAFNNAIKYDPSYADAYYQLGRVYHLQNKLKAAEIVFNEAIKLEPTHIKARLALAALYTESGEDQKAAEAWQTVLMLDPGNTQALEYFHNAQQQ